MRYIATLLLLKLSFCSLQTTLKTQVYLYGLSKSIVLKRHFFLRQNVKESAMPAAKEMSSGENVSIKQWFEPRMQKKELHLIFNF
jgi:hypothetical protein